MAMAFAPSHLYRGRSGPLMAAQLHPVLTEPSQEAKGMVRISTQCINPFQGIRTLAKPELGTKRLCANCGAKFYDLNHAPIVCPKCSTVFEPAVVSARARPEPAGVQPVEAEAETPEVAEAEFVSLEEADAEAQGEKAGVPEDVTQVEEEVEIDESLDDAAFIEEQEEEDTDVTEIIGGDIEDEEES